MGKGSQVRLARLTEFSAIQRRTNHKEKKYALLLLKLNFDFAWVDQSAIKV